MSTPADKSSYSAKNIKALTDREHLLQRMSLVFGSVEGIGQTYSHQKTVAIREILDNSNDESLKGFASRVKLCFFADRSVLVADNGRGLPVDVGQDANGTPMSGIVLCLGVLKAGSNFDNHTAFSTGMNGLGGAATIAVSKRADVQVYRGGKVYELSFKDGTPGFFAAPLDPDANFTPLDDLTHLKVSKDKRTAEEKANYPTGTSIRLWLRDELFSSPYPYSSGELIDRFKKTCYLVPGLQGEVYSEIDLDEDGQPLEETYDFDDGLLQLVQHSQPDAPLFSKVASVSAKDTYSSVSAGGVEVERSVKVDVAFSYGQLYDYTIQSFVNTINTRLGGVHVTAFERAMRDVFNPIIASSRLMTKKEEAPSVEDYREGLTAVVSVSTPEPTFSSQSKEELSGAPLQKAVLTSLTQALSKWAKDKDNADTLQMLCKKVALSSHNRQKARAARELDRAKSKLTNTNSAPEEMLDCEAFGSLDCELFICEGLSALSACSARDTKTQAVLPITGKFTNVYSAGLKRALGNKDIQRMLQAIGGGIGEDFDADKANCGKIFLILDADPDGNEIGTLVLLFLRFMLKDMLDKHRVYKVELPLFAISVHQRGGDGKLYAQTDEELQAIMEKLEREGKRFTVSRLKGLGEMEAADLGRTAFSPETRVVSQILVEGKQLEELDRAIELLFGPDTDTRKSWIGRYQGSSNRFGLDSDDLD